eukprot:2389319-Rhodomonas_salina.2
MRCPGLTLVTPVPGMMDDEEEEFAKAKPGAPRPPAEPDFSLRDCSDYFPISEIAPTTFRSPRLLSDLREIS